MCPCICPKEKEVWGIGFILIKHTLYEYFNESPLEEFLCVRE